MPRRKKSAADDLIGYREWAVPRAILKNMPYWMEEAIETYPLTRPLPKESKTNSISQIGIAGLCYYISMGASLSAACNAIGIYYEEALKWRKKGNERNGDIFEEIEMLLRMAEGYFTVGAIETVSKASKSDAKHWHAAAWLLERRHPEEWGRRQKIEQTTESTVTHNVVVYLPENGRPVANEKVIEGKARLALPDKGEDHGEMGREGRRDLPYPGNTIAGLAASLLDDAGIEDGDREEYSSVEE